MASKFMHNFCFDKIYKCVDFNSSRLQATIKYDASRCAFDNQSVILASKSASKVDIYNVNGTLKNTINIGAGDGNIKTLSAAGGILSIVGIRL
jgi:hypothetical protein